MSRGDKEKVTIRLHTGDRDRIRRFYPKLDYNKVIREIVKRHMDLVQAKFGKLAAPVPQMETKNDPANEPAAELGGIIESALASGDDRSSS